MPTQQKIDRVQDIKGRLERSSIALTASYSGISVNQMVALRRAMKAGGVDFTIVKNTLLALAADEAQKPQLKEIVQGPTAIAIGYEDPVEAAKAVADFVRTGGSTLAIIGAVMGDGAPMSPDEVNRLASLPSKPILLAMLLGQMQSPIARLLSVMNGPLRVLAMFCKRESASWKKKVRPRNRRLHPNLKQAPSWKNLARWKSHPPPRHRRSKSQLRKPRTRLRSMKRPQRNLKKTLRLPKSPKRKPNQKLLRKRKLPKGKSPMNLSQRLKPKAQKRRNNSESPAIIK